MPASVRRGLWVALIAAAHVTGPVGAQGHDHHHGHGAAAPDAPAEQHVHEAVGWAHPDMPPSPPPPLMGRQMGRVLTPDVPPLGYEMDGDVKVFHLVAQPIEQYLVTGEPMDQTLIDVVNRYLGPMHMSTLPQRVRIWGYNGTSPGPTIECTEGDRIRIVLKNELPEPTTLHSHSIELPNWLDGAGGIAEPPLPPGGTRAYEYTLYQSGTFLYHSHFNIMRQDSAGLAGLLVVHPREYAHEIDRDFALMLQEWKFRPGNPYPDLVSMDFNWFTFNGRSAPDIATYTVNQGDRVRIRIGNMSMDNHPIHLHGHVWKVVGTEGGPIPEAAQWPGTTVDVPPGSTRDVEFIAWNPGLWPFHCHKIHHTVNTHADVPMGIMGHGGMFTLFHVIPRDPEAPWRHPRQEQEEPADEHHHHH